MELGLEGRVVLLVGSADAELALLASVLEAEGALTSTSPVAGGSLERVLVTQGRLDAVVVLAQMRPGTELLEAGLDGLEQRWEELEELAGLYRAAGSLMASAGWGRLISVLPASVKWLDDHSDELETIVGLGVLGLHKAAVADLAPSGVAVNAVLRPQQGSSRDLADLVAFLLSDGAGYRQGITSGLDGATSPVVF